MGSPTIISTANPAQPVSFCVLPDKRLIFTNGLQRGWMWNGLTATADDIGITGPSAAATLTAGSGGACSAGTYKCYYRYVDRDGYVSNLSPVGSVVTTATQKIDWSVVAASSESRVVSKQLFRSLADTTSVVYLVATIANATTTYADDALDDTELADAMALPLLNPDGSQFANSFTPPPTTKAVAVMFQDRCFYGVDVSYTTGTVSVSNGSPTLTGTNTAWTAALVGRYFTIAGDTQSYYISAYTSATSLTISENYAGTGGAGQSYVIAADPMESNSLYFSSVFDPTETDHPGGPEAVLATNQFVLQNNVNDDDSLSALMPYSGDLYAFKQRHAYKINFVRQPNVDMQARLAAYRGCLNQRCWTVHENSAFVLDQRGIYQMDGGGIQPVSDPIGDLFQTGTSERIDWTVSKWFWAESVPQLSLVKFHVSFSGDSTTRPKRALVYHTLLKQWWVETYQWELGGYARLEISSELRQIYGAEKDIFYLTEVGCIDGLDSTTEANTLRGTVTSSGNTTLTASAATFPTAIADNLCPIAIVDGTGKQQIRRVVTRNSATQVTVDSAWTTNPVAGDTFQVGAIPWQVKFLPLRWQGGEDAGNTERGIRVAFSPTATASTFDIRRYDDHNTSPVNYHMGRSEGDGISTTSSDPDAVKDMLLTRASPLANESGYARISCDDGYVDTTQTRRWITPELRGYQGASRVMIYQIEVEGAQANG